MDSERWRQIEQLYLSVLELEPNRRGAFLAEACGGDGDLRHQVESLLARTGSTGALLDRTAWQAVDQTETASLALETQQIGAYRIVSRLGAGGMGEVYRAHDSKLGRDVAIKTLPRAFANDPDRLARFRREARVLASLNHPNIAAIYGLEESEGANCLILELVEGETLRERIERTGPLPLPEALNIARQIAEALEAAHQKGIVHRDLKPANVKVSPEGRVKVLDFGLAKAIAGEEGQNLSRVTAAGGLESAAGQILGTPAYMSPEQARAGKVDMRTDIWAFGCVLYELLTGKRPFPGETLSDTIAAILGREPEWKALPHATPAKICELLRQCLEKDADRRPQGIVQVRSEIEEVAAPARQGAGRWRLIAAASAAAALLAVGAALLMRSRTRPPGRSQWVQLTKFPDSVTQPALSPDGRMVTFIRGPSTFVGPGQIYVKILPDGEPVQLTHDNMAKMSPAFSPDGARIAYTVFRHNVFGWDTWAVPVLGGEPQLWLRNASGLVWTGPRQLLFSEVKTGVHMGIVSAEESRMAARDVYLPAAEPSMAHRSYLSPDGKWVLLVEMDQDHLWEPCRLVPADGSSQRRKVGPPSGGCTSGAWSPDGKSMYLTSNAGGANHIWRQRFPDGRPEQVTSGPTEEEGIAMAPDGRSFITAVALQDASLWVHDAKGERQVSLEGNAAEPRFTPDGKKLLYRIVREPLGEFAFYRDLGEVRVADLESDRSEPLVRGFQALDYDISADGRQVVMETADREGKRRLWLAPLDRSSPPRQIPNVEGGAPRFGPSGEILFRRTEGSRLEGTTGFVYRVRPDGTGERKAFEQSILLMGEVSPDGRWLVAWPGNGPPAFQAFPLDGGPPVTIGSAISFSWSPDGSSLSISSRFGAPIPEGRSYVIPLSRSHALPRIPAGGFHSEEDIASLPGARRIDLAALISDVAGAVIPGPSADVYAFYRGSAHRNLYRIPIP